MCKETFQPGWSSDKTSSKSIRVISTLCTKYTKISQAWNFLFLEMFPLTCLQTSLQLLKYHFSKHALLSLGEIDNFAHFATHFVLYMTLFRRLSYIYCIMVFTVYFWLVSFSQTLTWNWIIQVFTSWAFLLMSLFLVVNFVVYKKV